MPGLFINTLPFNVVEVGNNLDNILHRHSIDRCRLLKLDCEGSEYDVLAGLSDESLSLIENIIVEVHPARAGTPSELKDMLERKGFEVLEHRHGNGCSDLYCRRLHP